MSQTEARLRATKKYQAENIKPVLIKLNKKTDADIIKKLSTVKSKQGYIKSLIRKDMEQSGS